MGAAPQQHIDVHLARGNQQGIRISRRDDGVAVCEADAEGAVGDDFGEGEVGGQVWREQGFGVEVAADELEVGGEGAQEVVGCGRGEVAEAERLADFAGGEELFELCTG